MSRSPVTPSPATRRPTRPRHWRRTAAFAAVVIVPLAFAGLVVGAVSQVNTGIDSIPAAVVNNDEMITTTNPDGTTQQVLAGRQLVTELTGPDSAGFTWTITNSADAKAMLADGEVYAVLEVPSDFSKSILSLSSASPQRADLSIRTDDAHNYLTGSVAQTVGDTMAATFGKAVTSQYIGGLFSSIGQLGGALSSAADGATQISDGAGSLTSGLDALTEGTSSAQAGASTLAGGVGQYTSGVTEIAGGVGDYVGGVSTISSGVGEYVGGVTTVAGGVGQYVDGVSELSTGVGRYVDGVSQLAAGLDGFQAQASGLSGTLGTAATTFTQSVSALSDELAAASATLATDPTDATALATVRSISDQLAQAAAAGPTLASGVGSALSGITTGIGSTIAGVDQLVSSGQTLASGASTLATSGTALASGANQLATSGAALASGANQLATSGGALASGAGTLAASGGALASGVNGIASGLSGLESGAASATDGAGALATGAGALADGLTTGAAQVPTADEDSAAAAADVATTPVGVTVSRDNEVSDLGQIIATFFVPLGLWIGALAVFFVLRPASRGVLTSTAAGGRIALAAITRASAVTAAQAALLVALMHITLGVSWALLPVTILFSLLVAVSFTTFHYLLTVALGRTGLVVSLILLAIQITATGGLYPIQVLSAPFQAVSPFLPLTYAVAGMQAIISGSGVASALGAVLALVAFGLLSFIGSLLALRRIRRAGAVGLAQAMA